MYKRELREAFHFNSDGAGFCYNDNYTLKLNKGYFGFRKFYKAFRKAERENPYSTFMLHFRIATHGKIDEWSCHPFYIHKDLAFCHNGIMQVLGNSWLSDSADFVYNYLQRLPPDFIKQPTIWDVIDDIAAYSGSKFAFLDSTGKYTIANERAGHWKEGVWYSNYSYIRTGTVYAGDPNWWYGRGAYSSGLVDYEKCFVCDQYTKKYTMQSLNGHWYCEGCWSLLESETTILCPYCNELTRLKQDCRCEMCGTVINDEDVEIQLYMA